MLCPTFVSSGRMPPFHRHIGWNFREAGHRVSKHLSEPQSPLAPARRKSNVLRYWIRPQEAFLHLAASLFWQNEIAFYVFPQLLMQPFSIQEFHQSK
jgi:hypothetical protein